MGLAKILLFLFVASSPVPTHEKFVRGQSDPIREVLDHQNQLYGSAFAALHEKERKKVLRYNRKIQVPERSADGECLNDACRYLEVWKDLGKK